MDPVRAIKELGFPIAVALALGYFAWWQVQRNEEAVARWETLMLYVMELPADCRPRVPGARGGP